MNYNYNLEHTGGNIKLQTEKIYLAFPAKWLSLSITLLKSLKRKECGSTFCNRHFPNLLQCPRNRQWSQVEVCNEIVMYFLLTFKTILDFKPLHACSRLFKKIREVSIMIATFFTSLFQYNILRSISRVLNEIKGNKTYVVL